MPGLVIFVLSSADPGENETNAARWSKWVTSFMGRGYLVYHATVDRDSDPATCAYVLAQDNGVGGEDVEFNGICIVAHGGDTAHFLDDLARDAGLQVARHVRDFISGKRLAHDTPMRVQVCNAGRYPAGDTFQKNITPAGRTSTSPTRVSVLWNNGRFIDLSVVGEPGSLIGEAIELIRTGGSERDFAMLRKYVHFDSVSVLMELDEDSEKWKLKAGNAPPACNSAALSDNAFTKPALRAFLQHLAEGRGDGRTNYNAADALLFKAIPEAGRYSLIQFATGGATTVCTPD